MPSRSWIGDRALVEVSRAAYTSQDQSRPIDGQAALARPAAGAESQPSGAQADSVLTKQTKKSQSDDRTGPLTSCTSGDCSAFRQAIRHRIGEERVHASERIFAGPPGLAGLCLSPITPPVISSAPFAGHVARSAATPPSAAGRPNRLQRLLPPRRLKECPIGYPLLGAS